MLAKFYKFSLKAPSLIFANSTWTKKRLASDRPIINLYPPCQLAAKYKAKDIEGKVTIVSIGQFRPEKNQIRQLQIIRLLLSRYPSIAGKFHCYIIGGVRNDEDRNLFESLRMYSQKNNLEQHVSILANVSGDKKEKLLNEAAIGLHTMNDEHFGISIVEMMVRFAYE